MPSARTIVVGLVVLGVPLMCGSVAIGFLSFRRSLAGYYSVKLKHDRHEVAYRLGSPPQVVGNTVGNSGQSVRPVYLTDSATDPDKSIPAGKTVDDFADWNYPVDPAAPAGPYLTVHFSPSGRVGLVRCVDVPPLKSTTCDALAGVNVGESEEEVVARLGEPPQSAIDGTTKEIGYPDLGLKLYLTRGRVFSLALGPAVGGDPAMFRMYLRRLLWL